MYRAIIMRKQHVMNSCKNTSKNLKSFLVLTQKNIRMACFSTGRNSKVLRALSQGAINFYPASADMNMHHIPLNQQRPYTHFGDAGFLPCLISKTTTNKIFSHHEMI